MAARHGLLLNAEYDHRRLMQLAVQAEAVGFDDLWYADERFYRDTYVGLAACALATSRIRIGPGVTDPYTRHAALTAIAIASLDELSGGRAMVGLGAGLSGFRSLGLMPKRSTARLRESIAIMRGLWSGESVSLDGETIAIHDAQMAFAARPDVPIIVAANGPHNVRLAGAVGDGAMIPHCASPIILTRQIDRVRDGARRAGRDHPPPIVARIDVSVSRSREAAYRAAKIRLARYLWSNYPTISYLDEHGLTLPDELAAALAAAGPFPGGHNPVPFRPFVTLIPDELVTPIALAGTPDEVVAQARRTLAGGADQIMAYLLVPDGETIESVVALYGHDVLPQLVNAADGTTPTRNAHD